MSGRMRLAPLSAVEICLLPVIWAAIFGLTFLAEKTTLSTGQMAIWPADATLLALMLGPMRHRPILALLVCRSAAQAMLPFVNFPVIPGVAINIESTLGILVIYFVLKRLNYRKIHHSKNLLFLFVMALAASSFTAVMQGITINFMAKIDIFDVIKSCFAANFASYVVVTPLILILYDQLQGLTKLSRACIRSLSLLLLFSSFSYFVANSTLPFLFLIPLGLMALAYTTSLGTVACGVLIAGLFTLIATISGRGSIDSAAMTPSAHLLILQFFLATITTSILPMAARMAEHKQLREDLINARTEADFANSAKSDFLATISHEIRTPLNGVLGMAQIMALGTLEPVQKDRLKIIRRSGEVLLSILNDVLDLSKIEAGKLTLEVIDFDLGEVLRATTHAYGPLAKEKGLLFSQDFESVDGVYRGDPTRVRQILANLISNALKFTEKGAIAVTTRFAQETLSLAVKDTGIGIPEDRLSKLFAKFTQADETTTRRFGGTGLGLSICRDLASLMGGRIDVESQEGQGSTFTAVIPLVRIGDVEPVSLDETLTAEAFGAGVRVLAAEDNATNQLVLRTLLEMVGYDVSIAGNGQEAVALWEGGDWDVILMDVQMPVMDGPTATHEIRLREAATGWRRTPIIALTANTMVHQIESYQAAGMDGHVAKPIDAETLFQAVMTATRPPLKAHPSQSKPPEQAGRRNSGA